MAKHCLPAFLLFFVIFFSLSGIPVLAASAEPAASDEPAAASGEPETIVEFHTGTMITTMEFSDPRGNLHLSGRAQTLLNLGLAVGDLLSVVINDELYLTMPLVTLPTDVDPGEDMVLLLNNELLLSLRDGSIVDAYGLENGAKVSISLQEAGGYLEEYNARRGLFSLETDPDYSEAESWVYRDTSADKDADVFIIGPTMDYGDAGNYNMSLEDESHMSSYRSEINREKGLFEESANLYAPYYRQATLTVFTMEDEDAMQEYLDFAYEDVRSAFAYYLEHYNNGRPIILQGFSQGGYMVTRLIEEFFADEDLREQLVAAYAIGWCITQEDLDACPWLKMAQGETDLGVVISFECEAEGNDDGSLSVPLGQTMLSINPLTWSTGSEYADRSFNAGSVFMDSSGRVINRSLALTGAYIDEERGTLICPDLNPKYFPSIIPMFETGEYHPYDYEIFYQNIKDNVARRLSVYLGTDSVLSESEWQIFTNVMIAQGVLLAVILLLLWERQLRKKKGLIE